MTSDKDDMSAEYPRRLHRRSSHVLPDVPEKYIAKTNEENMKDTPLGTQTKAWGIPDTDLK